MRIALCVLALLFLPVAASAAPCRVTNLMPDYFRFLDETATVTAKERADLFARQIAPRYPDFYSAHQFGEGETLRRAATAYFDPPKPLALPGFAPLTEARLRAVAQQVQPAFDKAERQFDKTFSDFACGSDIWFGPSLFHFDGDEYADEHGRSHMLFGVDLIAMLHPPADMPAFLSHELFHVYHRQILGAAIPKDDTVVWWALWEEGLATYVSWRMNPPLKAQEVLWFPTDMVTRMEQPGVSARAAKLMLADFDHTGSSYARWFLAGHSAPDLPPRAGYYMGFRMAQELGRGRTLKWLAHLSPDEVEKRGRAFLEATAK